MKKYILIGFILSIASLVCNAQSVAATPNHQFSKVEIAYRSQDCSFQFSPVNFCDDKHVAAINSALSEQAPNFNGHYILLTISEYPRYHQRSVVAIDTNTGVVYPLPIDAYSGPTDKSGNTSKDGKVTLDLKSNKVCIDGTILVYRALEHGKFCFTFEGHKFVGHHTTYMD
ncbi:hypothetical protein [Paraburkholderia fungorum]|uniref:Uncharacterized protein n=1 Tax=Paraburkholderia fungorum TaxID=134537 RepID=A0AAW3V433_9BURK|nr:hypothetical protein [Paraburkholderia fungorum]MBB4515703.1 hypothetical protein [Paraburkholderia fungorum]MBB6203881.1 hypothetical protein [Paraburkholderia fungorum]